MKKIIVDKEEGIAEVIDRLLAEKDNDVTLVVPKGSALGRSVSNFHLLKREADAAGKTVIVESVDDTILAFAKGSDLEGSHPLWRGVRGAGGFSDIVPSSDTSHEATGDSTDDDDDKPEEKPAPKRRGAKKKTAGVKLTVQADPEEAAEPAGETEEEETEDKEDRFLGTGRFFKKGPGATEAGDDDEMDEDDDSASGSGTMRKVLWIGGAIIVGIVLIAWIVTHFFGRVAITIDFKQTPWSYEGSFLADKSISQINTTNGTIPAQVFSTQKNDTQLFPATGNANVSLKAQGTITIYNAYSSASQELVATTRFVTPDGQLFRLVNTVTVPGAQVTNGQIVPSSITAAVVADQPGPAYNVGAVAKLSIPGFQGTPKYDAFYGALPNGTSGGFVGNKAVPTAADITSAKAKMTATLQSNLASSLTTTYPNNFKIVDGATNVTVTKLTVSTTTDSNGNFSVFGEATLQAIGFDESAFKAHLLSLAQTQEASSTFKTVTLTYSGAKADFTKGTLSFALSAQGSLEPAFSVSDFQASIEGKGIGDARDAIGALPQLSDGKLSVWPMWLWTVPSNPARIEVTTN